MILKSHGWLPACFLLELTAAYSEVIEALLNQLHTMFANNKVTDPAYGAAVQAAYLALKSTGGRVVTFQTSLPATGPGKLKKREDMSLLGTPKEKTLFVPQEDFYTKLAKSCVEVSWFIGVYISYPSSLEWLWINLYFRMDILTLRPSVRCPQSQAARYTAIHSSSQCRTRPRYQII